eukprot:Hpha_TRINITY_DN22072_c0_g1::TRINITY_DN22072_c0_g1_i1::g.112145::m.112145
MGGEAKDGKGSEAARGLQETPLAGRVPMLPRKMMPGNAFAGLVKAQRHFGDVMRTENAASDGVVTSVWVNHREEVHKIGANEEGVWLKGPATFEPFLSIVPGHMIGLEGEAHGRMRRAAQRVLNDQVRQRLVEVAMRHAGRLRDRFMSECGDGKALEEQHLDKRMRSAALDIVSEAIFGAHWNAIEDYTETNERAHALSSLMHLLHWRVVDMKDRSWRRQERGGGDAAVHRKVLIAFVHSEIEKREQDSRARQDGTMLSGWMEADPTLTRDELENLCMTFLTMGHENVATAMSWTLIRLAEHPESQKRVRDEALRSGLFSPGPDRAEVTWASLSRLKLLDQAFLEASRLTPSVPALTRMPAADTQVCGYVIPKGQEVSFNVYGLNRDPAVWGQDAGDFKCPRSGLDGKEYLSFGKGARMCVGRPLSFLESKAVIGTLLCAFELRSAESKPVRPFNFVSLRPGKHRLHFQPLQSSASKL